MKNCKKCGKSHSKNGLYCSRSCANTRIHSEETKNKIKKGVTTHYESTLSERLEKKKESELKTDIIYSTCIFCNKTFIQKKSYTYRKTCSYTCYSKLQRENASKQEKKGVGIKGWYKGYWCDSSWELAYVIYNLEHNIYFVRNTTKYSYEYNEKILSYIPDFILEDGTYIEIKGYITDKWIAKQKQFTEKLILIDENKIQKYLDYVVTKYGSNFTSLYDGYKPKYEYICDGCLTKFETNQRRNTKHIFCSHNCNIHFSYKNNKKSQN